MGKPIAAMILVLAVAAQVLYAEDGLPIVAIEEVEEVLRAGDTLTLKVVFRFPDNSYQSENRDFFGVEIDGLNETGVAEVRYPEGIEYKGTTVYRGDIILEVDIIVPKDTSPGELEFTVNARYQLCDDADLCYFPQHVDIPMSITIETPESADVR